MRRYVDAVGNVSPSVNTASHVADIVQAMTPPPKDETGTAIVPITSAKKKSPTEMAMKIAPGIVAGAVGAYAWKEHRLLGFLAGHALGSVAVPLYKGQRTKPLARLGVEAAGIAGALLYKRHPVAGWVLGVASGLVVASFIPGSPIRDEFNKLKENF